MNPKNGEKSKKDEKAKMGPGIRKYEDPIHNQDRNSTQKEPRKKYSKIQAKLIDLANSSSESKKEDRRK